MDVIGHVAIRMHLRATLDEDFSDYVRQQVAIIRREEDVLTVIATHDGSIWMGANCGGITRFDGTNFQTYNEKHGLLNSCVWALTEDLNRDLWIGTWGGGAFRFHNGAFTQYSKGQGMADDRVTSIVAARDGSVWFGTRGGGLTRLKD